MASGTAYFINAPKHWARALLGESAWPEEARLYRHKLACEGRVIVTLADYAAQAESAYLSTFIAYGD